MEESDPSIRPFFHHGRYLAEEAECRIKTEEICRGVKKHSETKGATK